eukprot:gb/GECG01001598.1/.p1 GENE.gb/GECG01001598.1/~~gb/GECG01001598.1/.p1  ORF type:complete len:610 (+),score=98.56 gb/GECG01001598.1/:1-1830(+)
MDDLVDEDSEYEYESEEDVAMEEEEDYVYESDEDHQGSSTPEAKDHALANDEHSASRRATAEASTQYALKQLLHGSVSADERKECVIVTFHEMKEEMLRVVNETAEVLCLPSDEVLVLLNHFRWDDQKLKTQWFDRPEQLRREVGISPGDPPPRPEGYLEMCPITLDDDIAYTECEALPCGHWISWEGWRSYIKEEIARGHGCINLVCPEADCTEKVRRRLFRQFCSEEELNQFDRFLVEAFVDRNPHAKFCPAPNCPYMSLYSGGGAYDVLCRCGHMYCFACLEDAHRPAVCRDVKKWKIKNSSESENTMWIMANTKPCPKCGVHIEKNQGCNHMTCKQHSGGCGHEFCWMCLGPWSDHGTSSGGYYECNKYSDKAKRDPNLQNIEQSAREASEYLDRYMHYFSRYANHEKARKTTERLLSDLREKLNSLQSVKGLTYKDVECLENACNLLMEARRVLKWTYVFGYYCENEAELLLFEFLQQKLEKNMEYLQELVELRDDVNKFISNELSAAKMFEYLREVRNYMSVTQRFMQQMISGVENGLVETPSPQQSSAASSAAASTVASASSEDNTTGSSAVSATNGSSKKSAHKPKPPNNKSSKKKPKKNR